MESLSSNSGSDSADVDEAMAEEDHEKIHKKDNIDDVNAAEQEMMEVDFAADAMEMAEMADMQEQDAEMDMAMNELGNE
ncbi:Oidioi.mRNA.OKI2018_I69.chr2.g6110.t1.cds [Oikopleura dioica]|uniref:Oidioi.mRNA.OKI2018_I69.chr2.g6110.t1.cds n=1 Tax=Oikopleura dioica TaxID=34765 RepID=A0ABN7T5L9_OIKDI|nr:Oidioi.mRNA.OKI2018_I69.chr2.g6110.t1.cds [Oikopleura dioica]